MIDDDFGLENTRRDDDDSSLELAEEEDAPCYEQLEDFEESNYFKHAMEEFKWAGFLDKNGEFEDDMQKEICNHVLDLLEVFSRGGHSGTTAPYAISMFKKLANFNSLSPITDTEEEWNLVTEDESQGKLYQHKRCSHVFKDKDGAHDIYGKIFWHWAEYEGEDEPYASSYTNIESRVPVEFPYTPKKEYVFVPTRLFPNEKLGSK